MYTRNFTPERIDTLAPGEVFVFGSNLMGHHAGGAARIAHEEFGAIWGRGVGLQGQSYAIPTMQGGVDTIKPYVNEFIEFAKVHQDLVFYVTRIGCGIAGFTDKDIAPLFEGALDVENIILPESFIRVLEPVPPMPGAVRDMLYGQTRTLVDILKTMDKHEPVVDADDADHRISEFLGINHRYGDGTAFMAQRTIWSLLSRYGDEGVSFDLDRLEKDLYEYHDNYSAWDETVDKIYYRYCVSKMVRYVSFLNTFRRYRTFEEIGEDIYTVDNNHCGENPWDYFFGMDSNVEQMFFRAVRRNAEDIFKDGHLNEEALERIFFKNHQELVESLGVERMIEEQYGSVGCHDDIQAPIGRLVGPVYRRGLNGGYEVSCHGTDRRVIGRTWFEMRKAKEILERDNNYNVVSRGFETFYVPVQDFTLPVFSERIGLMEFRDEREKREFIEELLNGDRC